MRKTFELKILIRLVAILALPILLLAPTADTKNTPQTTEKVKFITATGIENFVKDLNDNGYQGYRLEKSLNFGGEGPTQSYAAIVRLDAPNKYEYDWMSSPDKKLLEGRLNYQAKKGFNFVNAYALTSCSGGSEEQANSTTTTENLILRLQKGDAFLLERKNGATDQSREYKVFIAKVRLGDSAEKTIQAGLDTAGPQGFRPVKILFMRQGLLDFSVSVLAEKDMTNNQTIESRFLKKTSGLPKDMNALAAQGFRFIAGRRIGMIGLALMEKRSGDAATYNFIEAKKHAKEFDKTIAQGNSYQAVMLGDLTCGSAEPENERLVFTQNSGGEKREYKIKTFAFNKNGGVEPESLSEFQKLLSEGYQVKDLFYAGGLNLIFEK
jgi:hypothetical protein